MLRARQRIYILLCCKRGNESIDCCVLAKQRINALISCIFRSKPLHPVCIQKFLHTSQVDDIDIRKYFFSQTSQVDEIHSRIFPLNLFTWTSGNILFLQTPNTDIRKSVCPADVTNRQEISSDKKIDDIGGKKNHCAKFKPRESNSASLLSFAWSTWNKVGSTTSIKVMGISIYIRTETDYCGVVEISFLEYCCRVDDILYEIWRTDAKSRETCNLMQIEEGGYVAHIWEDDAACISMRGTPDNHSKTWQHVHMMQENAHSGPSKIDVLWEKVCA